MVSHRRARVVQGAAAALLVPGLVLMGAGAAAAETFTNDDLPGKVTLAAGQSATVNLTTPAGFSCTDWIVRKVGQKRAVVDVVGPASLVGCTNDTVLTYTVSVPQGYANRATVVVKFKVYNADATARVVESLVVKVNPAGDPQTGKPAQKPPKGGPDR